jgi:tetratricopeptide (TPR) repeat protein
LRADSCLLAPILFMAALSPPSAQAPASRQSNTLSVSEAVSLYAQGEFDAAVERLDTRNLLVRQFTRGLDAWVAAGDETQLSHRKRTAAAFALEAGWHATRGFPNLTRSNFDPWGRVTPSDVERWRLNSYWSHPIVALWAVEQLPITQPQAVDRFIALAAVGYAEDGHAWNRLQHAVLPRVRRLFSDEPRFRLADALARTNADLGPLRYHSNVAALRDEPQPGAAGKMARAITTFTPLLDEPTLSGEVELRIGYLELRRRQWAASIHRFDAARLKATEPVLRATADYFAGWVHEQLAQPEMAVSAYRRAHAITPMMRNLTTRLSALLFLRGERNDAYALLDPALNLRPVPTDLLLVFERADARFVPEWMASIRKALR